MYGETWLTTGRIPDTVVKTLTVDQWGRRHRITAPYVRLVRPTVDIPNEMQEGIIVLILYTRSWWYVVPVRV